MMAFFKRHGLLISILTAAFLLRAYRFGLVPGGFNQDEAMAAYEAFSLALTGADRFGMRLPVHFTGWGFAQMNVLLSYYMVPFIKLFGLSAVTARLPMLLISQLALYALYGFSRDMFREKIWGQKAALTILAFAAVNPWHFMQARWALESNMFPHMLMIGMFWLHKGLYRERYLYLSMIAFSFSMYAYGIAFYTVPLMLLISCLYLLRGKYIAYRQSLLCIGLYILLSWPVFAVMLVNYFRLPSLALPFLTVPFFPDSARMNDLWLFSPNRPEQFLFNLKSLYQVTVLQNEGLPWNMIDAYGAMYRWFLPFALIGLIFTFFLAKKTRGLKVPGVWLLVCWFGVALFSGVMVNDVNINRVNIICYPLIFFTGLGLYQTVVLTSKFIGTYGLQYFKKSNFKIIYLSYAVAVVLTVVCAVSFIGFIRTYFGEHNRYLSHVFYEGFYDSLDRAKQYGFDRLYITAWTQYPASAYVSEIMTLYGLQIDPWLFRDTEAYRERYRYEVFNGVPVREDGINACYIFNTSESAYFPESDFEIIYFNGYGLAVFR